MRGPTAKLLTRFRSLVGRGGSLKKLKRAWHATPRPLRGKLREDMQRALLKAGG